MSFTPQHSLKYGRRLLIVAVTAGSFAASAAPAPALDCTTNANGIANSQGVAANAATTACAPAYGRKAGYHTGRKVG